MPFPVATVISTNYGYNPTKDYGSTYNNATAGDDVLNTLSTIKEQGGNWNKNSLNLSALSLRRNPSCAIQEWFLFTDSLYAKI